MQRTTFFDTPGLSPFLHRLARWILRIRGWRLEGSIPEVPKCVIIAAPHTSNWDFPLTLTAAFAFPLKAYWMGKRELFRFPFRSFFRWLGGIEIDRSRANDLVAQMVRQFEAHDRLAVIIPPEGTRKKVRYWKTGFYWIAHGAGVPIILGYLDYGRRAVGLGPAFVPTGDIEADMHEIRKFYSGVTGKRADDFGQADIRNPN